MCLAQGVTHQEDFVAVVPPPFQPFDKFSHTCVVALGAKEVRSYVTVSLAVNAETSSLRVFNLEWRHDYCTESLDTRANSSGERYSSSGRGIGSPSCEADSQPRKISS